MNWYHKEIRIVLGRADTLDKDLVQRFEKNGWKLKAVSRPGWYTFGRTTTPLQRFYESLRDIYRYAASDRL